MNAIVFTETRPLKNMAKVIEDHLQFLPDDFELVINCSEENKHLFKTLEVSKYNIVNVYSLHDYNRMMTNKNMWLTFIKYERVLIAQFDSMLLREGIEDFYEWDYVGAPWKFQDHGGNGGFSLRNPEVMYNIAYNEPYSPHYGYEDVYFCNRMDFYKLAPREVCEQFSCETIFKLGTLGYHAIKNYLTKKEIDEIKNQYKKSGRLAST